MKELMFLPHGEMTAEIPGWCSKEGQQWTFIHHLCGLKSHTFKDNFSPKKPETSNKHIMKILKANHKQSVSYD